MIGGAAARQHQWASRPWMSNSKSNSRTGVEAIHPEIIPQALLRNTSKSLFSAPQKTGNQPGKEHERT